MVLKLAIYREFGCHNGILDICNQEIAHVYTVYLLKDFFMPKKYKNSSPKIFFGNILAAILDFCELDMFPEGEFE